MQSLAQLWLALSALSICVFVAITKRKGWIPVQHLQLQLMVSLARPCDVSDVTVICIWCLTNASFSLSLKWMCLTYLDDWAVFKDRKHGRAFFFSQIYLNQHILTYQTLTFTCIELSARLISRILGVKFCGWNLILKRNYFTLCLSHCLDLWNAKTIYIGIQKVMFVKKIWTMWEEFLF